MTGSELASLLSGYRFDLSDEATLQEGIARVLTERGLAFRREVVLSRGDRIDFLVEVDIGLEVKVEGSANAVLRQLCRYAAHDRIGELLLVSSRLKLAAMPAQVSGKTLTVLALVRSLL